MIRKDELMEIGGLNGLQPAFAELDYLQDIALMNISRQFGNKLIFKGGTCLYKLYKLNRFSEDLDFTAVKGFTPKDFFHRLPYYFKLLNMHSSVKIDSFEKSMNICFHVHGPLYDGRKESRATLTLNISLRERVVLPVDRKIYLPNYQELRPFDLFAMDEREILAENVRAIYGRDKARDVYDLWYLIKIRRASFDFKLINKKLSHDRLRFDRDTFLAKVDEKELGWRRDLGTLVAGEIQPFAQAREEIMKQLP